MKDTLTGPFYDFVPPPRPSRSSSQPAPGGAKGVDLGASLLDWYMAHAPETPAWFVDVFDGPEAQRDLCWPRYWAERMLEQRLRPAVGPAADVDLLASWKDQQAWLDAFIKRAGFTHGWDKLESWARRMAEQALEEHKARQCP